MLHGMVRWCVSKQKWMPHRSMKYTLDILLTNFDSGKHFTDCLRKKRDQNRGKKVRRLKSWVGNNRKTKSVIKPKRFNKKNKVKKVKLKRVSNKPTIVLIISMLQWIIWPHNPITSSASFFHKYTKHSKSYYCSVAS